MHVDLEEIMRTIKGLGALALLAALIVGIPISLIALSGNPIPNPDALVQALTGVDYGGRILMGTILPIIGWIAWASFALPVTVELIARARNVATPQLPGFSAQQALAGALISSVLAIGGAGVATAQTTGATGTAPPASVSQSVQAQNEEADTGTTSTTGTPSTGGTADQDLYTVVAGDTLYGIAARELGDGSRWPELAEGMKATQQPDGRQLTDPHLIHPGMQVPLEDAEAATAEQRQDNPAPAPVQQEPPAAPAPAESSQTPAEQPTTAPMGEQAETGDERQATQLPGATYSAGSPADTAVEESTTAVPVVDQTSAAEDGVDWRTMGGIGSIAAAGLLTLIGARRMAQRRRRLPGQSVPLPSGDAAQLEAQLKTVAEPEFVDELDLVLRSVSVWAAQNGVALPEIFCLRITEDTIALYLDSPAELPEPFVQEAEDGTVWTIGSGQIEALDELPPAPYPGLVTIGKDDTGAQMLLDLEFLGTLGIEGDKQLVSEVLDAMAVELATSAWGENLQITLVGVADGLAGATETGRVRQVDDLDELITMLTGRAEAVRQALQEQGSESLHQAKSLNTEESWGPEIVLLGVEPSNDQADRLRELTQTIPRLGIAAVTTANPLAAAWQLHCVDEDNAELEPANLHLTPQRVTRDEAEKIISILSTALNEPTDGDGERTQTVDLTQVLGPAVSSHLSVVATQATGPEQAAPADTQDAEELETEELVVQQQFEAETAPAEQEQAMAEGAGQVVETETEHEQLEPASELAEVHHLETDEATVDREAAALLEQATEQVPMIAVLGRMRMVGARGQAPISRSTGQVSEQQAERCVALAAFLALNPGASAEAFHAAFWPNADPTGDKASSNRNKLAAQTRKMLGQDSDGSPFFPPVSSGRYLLDDRVLTDWQVLQGLIGADPVTASTPSLVAAMRLVRGAPFAHAKTRYLSWADAVQQEMVSTICDAAHELVHRSLATGNTGHAQLAARVGRTVDPGNEAAWRDALTAEAAAGNREEVARLVEALYEWLEDFEEGLEPETETCILIDQLKAHGYRVESAS